MKRIISTLTSAVMAFSVLPSVMPAYAEEADTSGARRVEYLTRGLTAVKTDGGVFMSWRLLGDEPLTQTYDIYKNGELYASDIDAVNYTDTDGFSYDTYQVVPAGTPAEEVDANCDSVSVWTNNYYDIPLNKPAAGTIEQTGASYTYSVNDASVADLDGDGELEYIIKWDPSNSQDNSNRGYTGKVYIDAYEFDGTQLWRIDLGSNIRAGAHYTQFIVYDFDGDGKAEMAVKTAPGSIDGAGNYVNETGVFSGTDADNGSSYVVTKSGKSQGMIISGEEYLTMFDGETGAALTTIDYPIDRGSVSSWGDSYGGRSERYLAGVAYLNGTTPSLIECRGYYEKASMAALDWSRDGGFTLLWSRIDTYEKDAEGNWGTYVLDETGAKTRVPRNTSIYGQGNHNLSICDADNDGKDEIVFGSAVVDDNGDGLNSTQHGHGDALHVTDFNNDGSQEVFQVHEDKGIAEDYGAEYRKAETAEVISSFGARADVGRGVMGNIDDEYASQHPNALSMYWCSASANLFDLNGDPVTKTVTAEGSSNEVEVAAPADTNFLIYWDGDLSRELLDKTRIDKFTVEGGTQRLETFDNVHSNNSSKATPAICADLFGDWREEVAFGTSDDTALRIFTTTYPTEYKLTTLMHDTQYRAAVAWQNVGYNQPAHLSYYVGSASLKSGANYLEPATGFDTVYYASEPELNTERESRETVIYTVNSFNGGNSEGFTNVTLTKQNAPYNNVARATKDSELDMRYLFDDSATPPPATTPEPPKATATPTYTEDFEDATAGDMILSFGAEKDVTVPPNEDYDGLKFYIGNRQDGDSTTNITVSVNGNPGNAAAMLSGKFADRNRAPRVELITPEADANSEIIAILSVKAEMGNALYYNDNTATQATNLLCDGDDEWHTLMISITLDSSGNAVRTFYIDDEQAASDNVKTLPVLWAAGVTAGSSVLIDNYSVRVEEIEAEATQTPEAETSAPEPPATDEPQATEEPPATEAPTPTATAVVETEEPIVDPQNCVKITAVYNEDGTLASVELAENAAAEEETPDAFTKIFYWSDMENMVPIAAYSGSFEPVTEETEAVTAAEEAETEVYAETAEKLAVPEETDRQTEVNTDTIEAVDAAYEEIGEIETYAADTAGTYKIAFDWKPGSTVAFTDQNGANIITITKNDGEPLKYRAGNGEDTVLHSSLNSQSSWYHIELVIDLEAKTVDVSAMDYTNNSEMRSVYAVGFAGADGYIASMKIGSGAYIDNVRVSEIEYLVPMTLYSFNVSDSSGEPIDGATVRIGSNSITTDENGHAAIKLKNDNYSYSAAKARYKSASGDLAANPEETEKTTAISLADGEERDVYVNYMFGDVNLLDTGDEDAATSEKVGTAYENTEYDVPDSIKLKEITYTFPTDEEDMIPGYEEYAGQTYTFVYDADASSTKGIIIGEGADTYIDLGYKIKRTPADTDTEVLDINFSEDGYESVEGSWSTNIEPEYMTDETYGTKYALISGLNTNKLTVNIPEYTSDNLVIEFDISFKELSWGGRYYGVTPYSGTTAGTPLTMRTSSEDNTQWQWAYPKDNYMSYAVGNDKGYTYSYNWKDRWAHVVMAAVPSENKFNVSIVNKDSGVVYLQDAALPFANNVGGSGKHITKLEFGLASGSASARDSIGIANLKAYTVGTPNTVTEETIDIYAGSSRDISANYHISDYEGMDFSISGMFDVTYVFESEPGTEITPSKMTIENGVIKVDQDATDEPAYVAVKYGDTVVKRYKLNWLTKSFAYGTIKSFESGETSPFTLTSKSGYHLTNSNGELLYSRDAGTAYDNNVWLNADIWTGELANEPVFSFDYRVESAQYKGYLILRDNNGTELVRIETHVYQPRMKIFQFPSDGSSNKDFRNPTFELGKTYTFVFKGNNYSSSDRTITLYIYNKGDYDYQTDTATADPLIDPITITPNDGSTNNGLRFAYEVAQNTGSSAADNGDMQYFDNFAYYYYKYE